MVTSLQIHVAVDIGCRRHRMAIGCSPPSGIPQSSTLITSVEPDKTTETLVARVFDPDTEELVPNVDVRLKLDVIANSGGHIHHVGRPKGELSSSSGQVSEEDTVLTGNTGASGLPFTFEAPAPAGDHTITGSCTDRTCTQDGPNMIFVGIAGIRSIPESNTLYMLIRPNRDKQHPKNHHLTSSLERGGLFDLNHDWNPPQHHEHRRGTVVDIRANNTEGAIPERNYPAFERLAGALGVVARLERKFRNGQEVIGERHYHVRLFGRAE